MDGSQRDATLRTSSLDIRRSGEARRRPRRSARPLSCLAQLLATGPPADVLLETAAVRSSKREMRLCLPEEAPICRLAPLAKLQTLGDECLQFAATLKVCIYLGQRPSIIITLSLSLSRRLSAKRK